MTSYSSKLLFALGPSQGRALLVVCLTAIISLLCSLPCHADPIITSVSDIFNEQFQSITIMGSGFGTMSAGTGTSPYIAFNDASTAPATTPGWQAGYSPFGDNITLIVDSWTDTEIVLGGLAGTYGTNVPPLYVLNVGDFITIDVWNAQGPGGSGFDIGPSGPYPDGAGSITTEVLASPEPGSLLLMMLGISVIGLGAVIMKRKDFEAPLIG